MVNILICGTIDKNNRGNFALLITRINILKQFFKTPKFTVFYGDSIDNIPKLKDNVTVNKRGMIVPFFPLRTLITLLCLSSCFIWFLGDKANLNFNKILFWNSGLKEYYNSDFIITTGGDVFSDDYGLYNFLTEFCGLLFGILLKKPVFIFSESVGPFKSRLTTFIARKILQKMSMISTRDKISFNYLKKNLNINGVPIYLTADTAFLLEGKKVEDTKLLKFLNKSDKLIGISLSNPISMWQDRDYEEYVDIMADIVDYLINELNVNILFIPHVISAGINDDRIISNRVFEKIKNKDRTLIVNGYGPEELKGIISQCNLFIGARMHSNIAALSSCVPTIALSYSIKTLGLMELLNLEEYCIDFKTMDFNELKSKIIDAWENRENINKHLEKEIVKMKKDAMMNGELVKKIVDSCNIS